MTDKSMNFESELEMRSLLPNRHYIILKPVDDDNFTMSAYDTTKFDEEDEYFPPAFVIQHGLVAILREQTEYVLERGMEELAHQHIGEAIAEYAEEDSNVQKVAQRIKDGNVVKVDFGREH